MKTFLGNRGVKEQILSFDSQTITSSILSKVENLLSSKPECFEPTAIRRVSVACAPLASWVTANVQYAKVLEHVRPLEKELSKTQAEVEKSKQELVSLNAQLTSLEAMVDNLKVDLGKKTAEVESLKATAEMLEARLQSSRILLSKLKGKRETPLFMP